MSGAAYWSHDIGGFEGTANPALYKRWVALGLLSTHSRLHGSGSYRVPWIFDEEAVDVMRHFVKLKNRLFPYLFAASHDARDYGWPVMRAMLVEFPDDPALPLSRPPVHAGRFAAGGADLPPGQRRRVLPAQGQVDATC